MKFFKEVTKWPDNTPNHTYILDKNKKMIGYIKQGTTDRIMFSKPIGFDTRYRKFEEVAS